MRRVLEAARKDYKKKLITKLSFLSVKSNWFEMLDTQESIKTATIQRLHTLNLYTDEPWAGDLPSPQGYFGANPAPEAPELKAHPSVAAVDRRIARNASTCRTGTGCRYTATYTHVTW